ncbi:MAG: hypothetical protein JXB14_06130 [Candidatus Altiarchaeota archaeon]|nr:hypothetical protein [Candidatus Altiarchaeota archaeon]
MKTAYILLGLLVLGMVGSVNGYGYVYFQNEYQFMTDEKPQVSLCGHNYGKVDLALYKLDVDTLYEYVGASDSSEAQRIIEAALKGGALKSWTVEPKKTGDWYDCQELDFTVSGKGMYFIKAQSNVSNQTTSFLISDLGVMTKMWGENMLIYTLDIDDGKPIQGANVNIYWDSKFLASKKTDSDGVVEYKIGNKTNSVNVVAEYDGNIAFVTPYYYYYGYDQSKTYVYTDRPVYRPNQRVYFKAIVWEQKDDSFEVPKGYVTVEIKDPKWNIVYTENLSLSEFGSVSGSMLLGEEPPLGNYQIEIRRAGSYSGYGSFEVQEYKKPEYKVELAADKETYIKGDNISVEISANYFFGSPVPDAEVEYRVYSSGYYYPCRGYWCWYYEEDYSSRYYYGYYGGEVKRGTTVTGSDGKARINFEAQTDHNSVFLIEATVTDKSRREASGTTSVIVARAEYDFELSTDKYSYDDGDTVRITIKSMDIEENPVSAYGKLEIVRRVWEKSTHKETSVYKTDFETDEKGVKYIEFVPDQSGNFEIKITSEDSKGNEIETTRWFYVYEEGRTWYDYWESLDVILDKDMYNVGDTAKVLINSPIANFTAFVALEANELYDYQVVSAEGTSARVEIPVKEDYEPNAVVYVIIVNEKTQYTQNAVLVVQPGKKFLNVEIISDKEVYEPRENAVFTIKTTDNNGDPVSAELSFGIVDESIYSIVEETTTQIERFFYGRRWSQVMTQASWMYGGHMDWDLRYSVGAAQNIAPSAAPMEAAREVAMDAMSGGFSAKAAAGLVEPTIREYFPDTAFWHAHVITDSNGEATVRVQIPDSLTTWKSTARAITKDFKVGQGTQTVIARKDLLVRLETPRFFTQNDELVISAVVHNYLGEMKDVQIILQADGINVLDSLTKTVSVAHGADERVDWNVAIDDCCLANITVKALTDVESDAMEMVIPIIPHGIEEQDVWAGMVDTSITKTLLVPEDSIFGATELTLTLSPSIAATAFDALDYLATYPYGCLEQTMSAFLPDVMVVQVLKDLGIKNEKLEEELPDMVSKGFQQIYNMQHSDGGWGWWENDNTHPYMTAYAIYGLTQAKNAGYTVDSNVLARGLEKLRKMYSEDIIDSNTRAYMAYSLSFYGEVDLSKFKESEMNDYARALKLLAAINTGVKGYVPDFDKTAICDEIRCHWESETFHYSWNTNNVETTSYVLMAMLKADPNNDKIVRTVQWLVENRRGNHWYSTKDTAIAVFALAEYLKVSKEMTPNYVAKVYLNGDLVASVKKDDVFSMDNELKLDPAVGKNEIKVVKEGQGKLYYSLFLKYFKMEESIKAKSNGITVNKRYSKTQVQSGEEINVTLTIDVPSDLEYIILEDPIPAGCEVVENREGSYYWDYGWSWWYSRREIRDEKVVYFMTYVHPGKNEITYTLRAEIPGSYHVMPGLAYNMYDEKIRGHSDEKRLDIVDKIRVRIADVVISPNELKFTVNALKFVPDDLSGEVLIEVEDEKGNLLKQKREYMSIKNSEENQEMVIPISLADGFYVISYTLTTPEGAKIAGSKRIQVGQVEVTRVGSQQTADLSPKGQNGASMNDLAILAALLVILVLIVVIITRMKEKASKSAKK